MATVSISVGKLSGKGRWRVVVFGSVLYLGKLMSDIIDGELFTGISILNIGTAIWGDKLLRLWLCELAYHYSDTLNIYSAI